MSCERKQVIAVLSLSIRTVVAQRQAVEEYFSFFVSQRIMHSVVELLM